MIPYFGTFIAFIPAIILGLTALHDVDQSLNSFCYRANT